MSTVNVLVIDDEPQGARIVSDLLHGVGFATTVVHSAKDARAQMTKQAWALVVIDELLTDGSGTDLAAEFRQSLPETVIAMSTVIDDEDAIRRAFSSGANYFVVKPNGFRKLLKARSSVEALLDLTAHDIFGGR